MGTYNPGFKPSVYAIENAVGEKFIRQAFESVVSNTFITALPLSDEEKRNKSTMKSLKSFCHKALESAGGYNLLLDAISREKKPAKVRFLKELNSICYTTATEAASRYATEAVETKVDDALDAASDALKMAEETDDNDEDETEEKDTDTKKKKKTEKEDDEDPSDEDETDEEDNELEDNDENNANDEEDILDVANDLEVMPKKKILQGKSLQELVLDAKMTDSEYSSLSKKATNLDLPKIAEIVNDKIVKAVNDEKKSYEKTDEANDRLKAAIMERDDLDASTDVEAINESVNEIYISNFGPTAPRTHASLFSTFQKNISQALIATEATDFSDIDPKLLHRVTCRALPSVFKEEVSLASAVEEALSTSIAIEGWQGENYDNIIKFSFISSIIVLTLLETLNTLNLHCFNKDEVKPCVDDKKDFNTNNCHQVSSNLNVQVSKALDNARNAVRVSKDITALEEALNNTLKLEGQLNNISKKGYNINKVAKESIETLKNEIHARLSIVDRTHASASEATSYIEAIRNDEARRAFEGAVASMANTIWKKRPDEVCFNIKGNHVHCELIKDRRPIATSTANITAAIEGITPERYFAMAAAKAGIPDVKYENGYSPKYTVLGQNGRYNIDGTPE